MLSDDKTISKEQRKEEQARLREIWKGTKHVIW